MPDAPFPQAAWQTRVHSVRRLPNSPSGNPRYELRTDQGTLRTAANSAIAYEIPNLLSDSCRLPLCVTVRTTQSGLLYDIQPL